MGNTLVPSLKDEDHLKFKKLLQFFVWQSSRNADNGRAEKPTKIDRKTKFAEHYGLEQEFIQIVNLDFSISFFSCGRFNTEFSTFINIGLLNIVGKFEKKKIVALRNLIRLDTQSISILGDLRKRCEERNRQLKYYFLEELGIEKKRPIGKISEALKLIEEPNDKLKEIFNKYLEMYNDFYEEIKQFCQNNNIEYRKKRATSGANLPSLVSLELERANQREGE